MGCATKCVAIIVIIFNLIFAVIGLAVVTLGVLLQLDVINYITPASVGHDPLEFLPIVIIVLGGTIIIVAIFGCVGIGTRGLRLLTTFIIILLILFALKVCFGLYVMFQINCEIGVQNRIDVELREMITGYSNNTAIKERMDDLQKKLHCCGVNGSSDWSVIPTSCCEENKVCTVTSSEVFARGCSKLIFDTVVNAVTLTYIISFCVGLYEVLGAILTTVLVISIKNDDRRERYSQY